MRQLDLISRSRADQKKPQRARGFFWSFVVHGVLISGLFEVSFYFGSQLALLDQGNRAGTQVISLQTMRVVSQPSSSSPRSFASTLNQSSRSLQPEPGVALVPGQPTNPTRRVSSETGTPVQQVSDLASNGGGIGHLRPSGNKFVLSSAPGALPYPPYPDEARDLQESGIVKMLVQFDKAGNVARADVVHSSGVALLDLETREFIRDNWHSSTFAGQAVRVPVEYSLTSL